MHTQPRQFHWTHVNLHGLLEVIFRVKDACPSFYLRSPKWNIDASPLLPNTFSFTQHFLFVQQCVPLLSGHRIRLCSLISTISSQSTLLISGHSSLPLVRLILSRLLVCGNVTPAWRQRPLAHIYWNLKFSVEKGGGRADQRTVWFRGGRLFEDYKNPVCTEAVCSRFEPDVWGICYLSGQIVVSPRGTELPVFVRTCCFLTWLWLWLYKTTY